MCPTVAENMLFAIVSRKLVDGFADNARHGIAVVARYLLDVAPLRRRNPHSDHHRRRVVKGPRVSHG